MITIEPFLKTHIENDTLLCNGTSLILNLFNHDATYQWNTGSTATNIEVTESGTYKVEIKIGNYKLTDSIEVNYYDCCTAHSVNLGNDTLLCIGEALLLNVYDIGASYEWNTGLTNHFINVSESVNYKVKIITESGCKMEDSINVYYYQCCAEMVIPNLFTPNGDDKNDNLIIGFMIRHFPN